MNLKEDRKSDAFWCLLMRTCEFSPFPSFSSIFILFISCTYNSLPSVVMACPCVGKLLHSAWGIQRSLQEERLHTSPCQGPAGFWTLRIRCWCESRSIIDRCTSSCLSKSLTSVVRWCSYSGEITVICLCEKPVSDAVAVHLEPCVFRLGYYESQCNTLFWQLDQ